MKSARDLLVPVIGVLREVRTQRGLFVRSTLSMTLLQLGVAAAAGFSTTIATQVTTGSTSSVITFLFIGLAASVVLVAVCTWVESWLSHLLAYRVIEALRMRVYDALQRIVPARIGKRRAGEVAGTALGDAEALEWFYAHTLGTGINAVASPLLISIALCTLVGPVGLIVPAGIAVLLAIPWCFCALQVRQGAAIRERLGSLQAIAFEGAEARRELAVLGLEAHHRDRVLQGTASVQASKRQFALRSALETGLADFVVAATSLGFLWALLGAATSGQLDATLIPAALVLATAAVVPAIGAFHMVQRLGEMSAAARRILELLQEADADGERNADVAAELGGGDEHTGSRDPESARSQSGRGALEFSSVSFGYADDARVLEDFRLSIRAGEHIALVGASGAGKSTVARLLTGMWRADSGTITLDGTDIGRVDSSALRREVSLVAQHPFVFRGTVRSNLLLAAPEADDAALWGALADAGLSEYVTGLDGGLDAPIGDRGATISGGQRQRLSIAQALLRDPAVLVLDEASAALDSLREASLAQTLHTLRKDRTTIVIAHRVSTIRRSPRVVLLSGGRVDVDGPHDELVASSAKYRALIAHEREPDPSRPPVGVTAHMERG